MGLGGESERGVGPLVLNVKFPTTQSVLIGLSLLASDWLHLPEMAENGYLAPLFLECQAS